MTTRDLVWIVCQHHITVLNQSQNSSEYLQSMLTSQFVEGMGIYFDFFFIIQSKPVLTTPCIQQLPVLSDRFHSSQWILLYTLTVFNDPLPYVTNDCLFSAVWKVNPVLTDFHNCWYLYDLLTTSHSQIIDFSY